MVITQHGVEAPFLKGVTKICGLRLTFFGPDVLSIIQKENEWLEQNAQRLESLRAGQVTPEQVVEDLRTAA